MIRDFKKNSSNYKDFIVFIHELILSTNPKDKETLDHFLSVVLKAGKSKFREGEISGVKNAQFDKWCAILSEELGEASKYAIKYEKMDQSLKELTLNQKRFEKQLYDVVSIGLTCLIELKRMQSDDYFLLD